MTRASRPALAACLAVCLVSASAFAEMSLTYTASLAEAVSGDTIAPLTNLTADAEMTVMLYPGKNEAVPLWCRRFATEIVDGRFAAVLTDSNGSNVVTHATYGTLERLFARTDPSSELWVEVSDVRTNGQPVAGMSGSLPRGKIAAAPFAVVADRAACAHSGFCVRGTATVAHLTSIGNFDVTGRAEFADAVTFEKMATFGECGLSVTGTVSKTNLGGIGTLTADSLVASKHIEVGALAVTNGTETTLSSSATGFVPPEEIRVAGTFTVGGTLTTTDVTVDCLTVDGRFSLHDLHWAVGGNLSVPDGVYEADSANAKLTSIGGTGETTYENTTGKNVLLTYTVGAQSIDHQGGTIGGVEDGPKTWVYCGSSSSVGVNVTTLFPLANGNQATAQHVFTRYVKELSK